MDGGLLPGQELDAEGLSEEAESPSCWNVAAKKGGGFALYSGTEKHASEAFLSCGSSSQDGAVTSSLGVLRGGDAGRWSRVGEEIKEE